MPAPLVDEVLAALDAQLAELDAVIGPLDDAGWARPSRCDGWTVADVVLHLAQTNEMGVASVEGRYRGLMAELAGSATSALSVDEGADWMVSRERGAPNQELLARWRKSAADLGAALAAADPHARCEWVVGTLAARTLATTRLAETWIHTGDVCFAFGGGPAPTDRLWHILRLAWRTLPYAFERDGRTMSGPVTFELTSPSGTAWTFTPDEPARTVIRGDAHELCQVAARRVAPADTGLTGDGPDVDVVLAVIRTWA